MNLYVMRAYGMREEGVLELLKKNLNEGMITPFVPKKEYPLTKNGELIRIELKTCFPGFVFFRSEKDARYVIGSVGNVLREIS